MPENKKKNMFKVKGNNFYILLDKRQKENPITLSADLQSSVEELKSALSDKEGLILDTLELIKVEYMKGRWNFRPVPWKEIAMELLGIH